MSTLITRSQLAKILGLSVMTIIREEQRGNIPAPIRISMRRVGWELGLIKNLLAQRRKEADATA